jgi:translation initiation factor IF-2
MASEFGISSEDVMLLLRQMDVPVRSHLSLLTDDQVARVRARWEREKRARAEKASPAPTRRRKGAAAAPTEPAAPKPAKPAKSAGGKRKKAAAAPEPAAEPENLPGTVRRRRRPPTEIAEATAPEVAEVPAAAADAAGAPAMEGAVVGISDAPSGVVEAPAAPQAPAAAAEREARSAEQQEPSSYSSDAPGDGAVAPAAAAGGRGGGAAARQRPRPVVPGAPRMRQPPFQAPRPVASAAPGSAPTLPPRRDDKKAGGAPPGRRKKGRRGMVDREAVSQNITRTMTAIRGVAPRRGRRTDETSRDELDAMRAAEAEREKLTVRVNEFITVSELADILKVPATQIVAFAFKHLNLMVTINQRIDFDQIELIASEFGFQAVREEEYKVDSIGPTDHDLAEDLEPRPPIVTIMGHVDHGKTSLLDYIRKANVVAGEAGGITQHIGAYHVTLPSERTITFLDTPGHEAFTAMRARGAQVTDIVVLVVAADDQVMPQTIEAISHAKSAGVPMVVAINKVDLPGANPGKVKQDLLQHGVVLEEFGGQTLATEVSAKKGTNISTLLDQILLQAEVLDLRANPNKRATGTVIEAQLDPGKGPVATVLITGGTLHVGDDFVCGMYSGRIRALMDERGKVVKVASPAIPVQVLGLTGVPMAGDQLVVLEDAGASREIAQRRQRLDREAKSRRTSKGVVTLEDFMAQSAVGERRNLGIVIKADQGGPAEALADALAQLSNDEVRVEVIHRGVGAITESDILLARAAGAVIIGFHVRPDSNARAAAEREGVDIKLYRVIYDAVADVRAALEGLLRPEEREVTFAEAEVRDTFRVPRAGVIAGCFVRNGIVSRQGRVRIVRDGVEVYDGTVSSLRRFKDDVREVREGFECGIGIENFNDIKVGDVLEFYRQESVARTLAPATSG